MALNHYVRTQERYYSLHHRLFQIARIALKNAVDSEEGRELNVVTAITFSALGAEAFCNALGYRVAPDWEVFEELKTVQKFEALSQCLNVPFSETSKPWQTLFWLIGFRNDIVHGKPEHIKTHKVLPDIAVEKTRLDHPKSKLESLLTIGNAKRAVQATKDVYEIFRLATPIDVGFEIFQDGWSGSVTALVDKNGPEGSR
jgi:hypothetical protein